MPKNGDFFSSSDDTVDESDLPAVENLDVSLVNALRAPLYLKRADSPLVSSVDIDVKSNLESDLAKFPRPSVAADVAVLSVVEIDLSHRLVALAVRRGSGHASGTWALPGRMLREYETLDKTAHDAVRIKLGIGKIKIEQLRVFDEPDRDPRGWVLSVAHIATVPTRVAHDALTREDVAAIFIDADDFSLPHNQTELPYEQQRILKKPSKNFGDNMRSYPIQDTSWMRNSHCYNCAKCTKQFMELKLHQILSDARCCRI